MAIQPDPYFALPSLYGAPAYSRPPRPPVVIGRPIDPDDLPLSTQQTEEERRLADALLASGGRVAVGSGIGHELPGAGDPGYRASVNGHNGQNGPTGAAAELLPHRLSLRVLADRIRTRG